MFHVKHQGTHFTLKKVRGIIMKKQNTLAKEATRILQEAKRCDGISIYSAYQNPSQKKVEAYMDCVNRIPAYARDEYHGVAGHNTFSFTFYASFEVNAVRSDGVKVKLNVCRYETSCNINTIIFDWDNMTFYEVSCEDNGYRYVARDNNRHTLRAWNVERG